MNNWYNVVLQQTIPDFIKIQANLKTRMTFLDEQTKANSRDKF